MDFSSLLRIHAVEPPALVTKWAPPPQSNTQGSLRQQENKNGGRHLGGRCRGAGSPHGADVGAGGSHRRQVGGGQALTAGWGGEAETRGCSAAASAPPKSPRCDTLLHYPPPFWESSALPPSTTPPFPAPTPGAGSQLCAQGSGTAPSFTSAARTREKKKSAEIS